MRGSVTSNAPLDQGTKLSKEKKVLVIGVRLFLLRTQQHTQFVCVYVCVGVSECGCVSTLCTKCVKTAYLLCRFKCHSLLEVAVNMTLT